MATRGSGGSFLRPGEKVRANSGPDYVRVFNAAGARIGMRDISGCKSWKLDHPYTFRTLSGGQPQPFRVSEEARLHYDLYFGDWGEFRFVISSPEGCYFLLGAPSRQWYRDKVYLSDGYILLLNEPAFHGEIGLVKSEDRQLTELTAAEAAEILIDSGHAADLPKDLRAELSKTIDTPDARELSTAPIPHPEPDQAEVGDGQAPIRKRRPRNQGKADRCVGLYVAALERNETPHTATELAKLVGCNKATASRAIAPLEAKRKEMAREDAKGRYRRTD